MKSDVSEEEESKEEEEKLTPWEEFTLANGLNTDEFRAVTPALKVLNIGCGTSLLAEELFERDGFRNVLNVDRCKVAVRQMKQRSIKRLFVGTIACK